jgi:hypothetical protein
VNVSLTVITLEGGWIWVTVFVFFYYHLFTCHLFLRTAFIRPVNRAQPVLYTEGVGSEISWVNVLFFLSPFFVYACVIYFLCTSLIS